MGSGTIVGDAMREVGYALDFSDSDNWLRRFGRYLDESFITGPSLPEEDEEDVPGPPVDLSDAIARDAADTERLRRGMAGRRGTFLTGPGGAQGRYPLTRPSGRGY